MRPIAVMAFAVCGFTAASGAEHAHEGSHDHEEKRDAGEVPTPPPATIHTGIVSGTITVQKGRKVKTDGPKSYRDVVVYIEAADSAPRKGAMGPGEHSVKNAKMDQKGLVFSPHVLAVRAGTTVEFQNSDTVNHNVFCVDKCCGVKMDLGQWGRGAVKSHAFNTPGVATLLCKLHPEMAAYVVVLDSPHFTSTELDGKTRKATYRIVGVPPGRYTLKTWHKKMITDPVEVVVEADAEAKQDLELKRKSRRRRR